MLSNFAMKSAAAYLVFTMLSTASIAQVFVCKEANGNTTYSGTPCGPNNRVMDPNQLRQGALDTSDLRRQNERSESARQKRAQADSAPTQVPAPPGNFTACPSDLQIRNLRVAANSLTPSSGAGYRHALAKRVQAECLTNGGDAASAEVKVRAQMAREDEENRPLNCVFTGPGTGICH